MLKVSLSEVLDRLGITIRQRVGYAVVARPVDAEELREVFAPSRLGCLQDGYFFGRLRSAVALPSML